MDWGRAKTILILSFLCLNLLLGYQLLANRWSQASSAAGDADLIEETKKLLEAKKIQVAVDIPKETPVLSSLNVRFPDEYRTPKQVKLPQPIKFVSLLSRSTVKELQSRSTVAHFDAYRLDPVMSGSGTSARDGVYWFHQLYKELPMFDVTLQLFTENGEITGYKQSYVEVKSEGEPNGKNDQKIISAYAAIRSLAENYLKEGAVITDIRLGYHGQIYDSEDQTFVPNWRITLSQGEPYYVHAFTGAVEGYQSGGRKTK